MFCNKMSLHNHNFKNEEKDFDIRCLTLKFVNSKKMLVIIFVDFRVSEFLFGNLLCLFSDAFESVQCFGCLIVLQKWEFFRCFLCFCTLSPNRLFKVTWEIADYHASSYHEFIGNRLLLHDALFLSLLLFEDILSYAL